jgi:hypothetical protein
MKNEAADPLFSRFLGADFASLPPAVRAGHDVHAPLSMTGRARVTRGTSLWSRVLAGVFGFPPAADDVAVRVTMTPQNDGELWERRFGDKRFWSFLSVQDGAMTETFGPFTFRLGLHVADGMLFYPVASGRLGPIPLPRFLLPQSTAREFAQAGRFHFDVQLHAPLTGALMVHYQGWLVPEGSGLGDGDQEIVERP